MRTRFTLAAVLAVAGLVLVAAGCGGGGGKLSKEEYGSKLNQICTDYNATVKNIGQPQSISELADKGPKLRDEFDSAISKAEKLKPPDELKATADQFIAKAKQLSDVLGQLIDAAKANDTTKVQQIGAQVDSLSKESDALGTQLGAPACAEG